MILHFFQTSPNLWLSRPDLYPDSADVPPSSVLHNQAFWLLTDCDTLISGRLPACAPAMTLHAGPFIFYHNTGYTSEYIPVVEDGIQIL